MIRVALRRFAQALLTALAASLLVWAMLPLAPGDPAYRILYSQTQKEPLPAEIEALRHEMGLDKPLPLQYAQWLGKVARGDLARSWRTGQPVAEEISRRLPATLTLVGLALVVSVAVALLLALISAAFRDRWPDRVIRVYTQIGAALPTFLFGLLALQYIVVGAGVGKVLSGGALQMAILPALIIGIDRAAGWTQLLRASLIEAQEAGFAQVARARGARPRRILLIHALPNAALPFLTAIGVSVGALLGGSPIIEELFTWPGLGSYTVAALSARDFPVIQAFVLISALLYVAASLLIDLAAIALDPRLREAHP
ncbi:peptide/nickel transport system permease protein [Pseudooceanicola antarcticus]|uniref:ABC transporter permease n=1 Tax=Pseudooceanicola antarcticus TaxID=1247613 RepID=A0A285J843_9RHOB|nr:ABC transporter permease [Pseudooceanicola antarcticus]PJE27088.1 ABC transporter permease [Pseudooceanicola antarcticus]SNY56444.1 peptide/nickel transport system permease protein [Pseudooceanicola antarcticus]